MNEIAYICLGEGAFHIVSSINENRCLHTPNPPDKVPILLGAGPCWLVSIISTKYVSRLYKWEYIS